MRRAFPLIPPTLAGNLFRVFISRRFPSLFTVNREVTT